MEPLLEVKNLSKVFGRGKQQAFALRNINLQVNKGETLGIVGESGSGKSTLARTIMGVHTASEGEVLFHGEPLDLRKHKARKDFARQVQMIFQDPYASLDPRMAVEDILMENLEIQGEKSKKEKHLEVEKLFEMVGLSKDYSTRYPHEFSGGQRQRIGIARALTLEPELIICDEPISALDISIQSQIMNLLMQLKEEKNLTLVFIAHDLNMVRYISDRIAVIHQGEIVEIGQTEDIYQNPTHAYTKTLLNAALTLENRYGNKEK